MNKGSKAGNESKDEVISGDIDFPKQWTVFAPLERSGPPLPRETLDIVPETITVTGNTLKAQKVTPTRNQFDFRTLFGKRNFPEPGFINPEYFEKTAYAFVPLTTKVATEVTLGLGGDAWLQAWVNGEPILGGKEVEGRLFPPSINDYKVKVSLKAGMNVLAVRFAAGKGSAVLALGGPRELRGGDYRSILDDPLFSDARWTRNKLRAKPGTKPVVDIGSRRISAVQTSARKPALPSWPSRTYWTLWNTPRKTPGRNTRRVRRSISCRRPKATNGNAILPQADKVWYPFAQGKIADIEVRAIMSTDGYRAVRLLSNTKVAESPVDETEGMDNILIDGIYGNYFVNAVLISSHIGSIKKYGAITLENIKNVSKTDSRMANIYAEPLTDIDNLTIEGYYHKTHPHKNRWHCLEPLRI